MPNDATANATAAADVKDARIPAAVARMSAAAPTVTIPVENLTPKYGVVILCDHLRLTLEIYDRDKGFLQQAGVTNDEKPIIQLRGLFNSLKSKSEILNQSQLFVLAKIISEVDNVANGAYGISVLCNSIDSIKVLFGKGRCAAWRDCYGNRLTQIKAEYFSDFFMVPDNSAQSLLALINLYYDKFPFLRIAVLQNPILTDSLYHLLLWLHNRGILNESNVRTICQHANAVDLFKDAANIETESHYPRSAPSYTTDEWYKKISFRRQDCVLQQMLFNAIIQRAEQLKVDPVSPEDEKSKAANSGIGNKNAVSNDAAAFAHAPAPDSASGDIKSVSASVVVLEKNVATQLVAAPSPNPQVVVWLQDIKNALDVYDQNKGILKHLGLRNDEKSIVELRSLFNSIQPFDRTKVLNLVQLLELAKIVCKIDDRDWDDAPPASSICVRYIKTIFGKKRCLAWGRDIFHRINHMKFEYFADFFAVSETYTASLLNLIDYYPQFPFLRTIALQNPEQIDDILHLIKWLKSRKILNETNMLAVCAHADSTHLFRDAANIETMYRGKSSDIVEEWCDKQHVRDPILQQMIFDVIVQRAVQLKAVPVLIGVKDKNSILWKFFGNTNGAPNYPLGELKALKEVFAFLRPEPERVRTKSAKPATHTAAQQTALRMG